MAMRKTAKKKRAQRASSNVFAMFDQQQIGTFKEAFNMIDQNHDGFVDKEDLADMYASLGQTPSDADLEAMVNEAPGTINFTMFLTLFGQKMQGTDPVDVLRNAFSCFDEEGTGKLSVEKLRELLMTMGDRLTEDEVDAVFAGAPIDRETQELDYREFSHVMVHGEKEEEAVTA
eukprot:Clim_evm5s150 gene=Clim_evmTU5s150